MKRRWEWGSYIISPLSAFLRRILGIKRECVLLMAATGDVD